MNLSKIALLLLVIIGVVAILAATASADPGNEIPEDATDVYDGGTESHTVQAAGGGNPADDDWFRVFATEGQVIKLGLLYRPPLNGLAGIRVFGPDGWTNLLARSTVTDVTAQEIDMFVFANGTYYIRVYVFDGTDVTYEMHVRIVTPPVLTSGTAVSNTAHPLMGRVDSSMWYRVWLEGGSTSVEMAVVTMTWTGDTNTHVSVLDRKDKYSLGYLNYSWSINFDHNEECQFAASYSGYYYIRVYTTTLYSDPIYGVTFSVKATVLGNTYKADGNVQIEDAELLEIRSLVHGKINQAYDTHQWYKFDLNKGEQFSAKATVIDPMLNTYRDFYNLTLYTYNGTILTGAINQGSTGDPISSCSVFLGRAPYTGLYYLSFSAYYSLSGQYGPNGKLINSCRFEIDVLIPNRRVWIIDPPGEIRMNEDEEVTIDLTTIFWDPEGDDLSFGTSGAKENFTLPLSQSTGILTIRPNANWYGTDTLIVWAHDGRPDMKNQTTITITVRSVPDPPYVRSTAPSIVRIKEDEINYTALNLKDVFGDVDIEDRLLIYSSDKNENVNINIIQTNGSVTLWGVENYNGQQRITFYATDSYNYRVSHDISVIVEATNDAPVAVGKIPRLTMVEDTKTSFDVEPYFFDIDGDPLYYYVSWEPEEAIAFDNADSNPLNSFFDIYPDDPNFNGYVQVTFKAYDRDRFEDYWEVATQTAILEVENENDPPRIDVWTPDGNPTIEETEYVVFEVPRSGIYDVDSDDFRWRWFVNDEEQTDVLGETFEFPQPVSYEDEGVYVIRCELKDAEGAPANVNPEWTLTILNKNREPTVYIIDKDMTIEEGSKIRLRAEGNDPDDDALTFEWYEVDDAGREKEVGRGRELVIDKPYLPGSYRFMVYVYDSETKRGSEQIQVDVQAHDFPPTVPGFGPVAVLAAMIGGMALAVTVRRRR